MPPITLVPIGTPMTGRGGVSGQHTAQMCCLACGGDDDAKAVGSCVFGKLLCRSRGAVGRDDTHIKRDAEILQLVCTFAHHLQVAVRTHDNANFFHKKDPPSRKIYRLTKKQNAGYGCILHGLSFVCKNACTKAVQSAAFVYLITHATNRHFLSSISDTYSIGICVRFQAFCGFFRKIIDLPKTKRPRTGTFVAFDLGKCTKSWHGTPDYGREAWSSSSRAAAGF